jgi:hypothetical protein
LNLFVYEVGRLGQFVHPYPPRLNSHVEDQLITASG